MRHSTTMMMTVQLLVGLKNRMSKLHRKIKLLCVLFVNLKGKTNQ